MNLTEAAINLKDVTLFGQSYMVYMALIMIAVITLKSLSLPKRASNIAAVILLVLAVALIIYVVYRVIND